MIRSVELENWVRFKGRHVFELTAGVWAIVGSRTEDEQSSNWIGKTSLLEAIGSFVLFGWHSFATEDAWISHGEERGSVRVCFDDFTIERSRARGKRTSLLFVSDAKPYEDDDAQAEIAKRIGLTWDDFLNTHFFKQKKMSRFVTARPADRQAIVTDWLQLNPLEEAIKHSQDSLRDAIERQVQENTAIEQLRERERMLIPPALRVVNAQQVAPAAVVQLYDSDAAALAVKMKDAELERSAAQATADTWRSYYASKKVVDEVIAKNAVIDAKEKERAALVLASQSELPLIKQQIAQLNFTPAKLEAAVKAEHAATVEQRRLAVIAQGKFDGACPVSAGFECPATAEINSRREPNRKAAEAAAQKAEELARDTAILRGTKKEHEIHERSLEQATRNIESASFTRSALPDAPVRPFGDEPDMSKLAEEISLEGAKQMEASNKRTLLLQQKQQYEQVQLELKRSLVNLAEAVAIVDVARASTAILKQAHKQISETEMLKIEAMANESLLEAGIDLSLRLAWGRETQGLATACEICGNPYPSSTKVRSCTKCGQPRGPKIQEKLNLELSDRSGAAEDTAGIMLQDAAKKWLRTARSSSFDIDYIDEPFGALDPVLSRALASFIARRAEGQTFVIAHDRSIMDAMPNRITVIGEGSWSRIEVSHG